MIFTTVLALIINFKTMVKQYENYSASMEAFKHTRIKYKNALNALAKYEKSEPKPTQSPESPVPGSGRRDESK